MKTLSLGPTLLSILLADDSHSDAKLFSRFAKMANVANPIDHVESGALALEYLQSDKPLPGLILLDINMPLMNGHEVLQAIRGHDDPEISRLPVVFLTTSNNPDEVRAAYSEHANSYVVKPVDALGFQKILGSLADYWFETVRIPGSGD